MNLTLEQIQQITVGAAQVTQDAAGFHFTRFSGRQKEAFGKLGQTIYNAACSSAGICLSFHTDAQNILIIPIHGYNYEVLIDDNPLYFFRGEHNGFRIALTLPAGDKHVTVLFPHHSEAALMNIIVDNGAYIRPHTYDRKFLFLGDSIVQGQRSERDCQCFASIVGRFFNAETMNLGVGGSRMDKNTLIDIEFDPDTIIISYGTNDYTKHDSAEALESACKEYFERINELYPNKRIFYISPIWRADHGLVRNAGTLDTCRKRLIQLCQNAGFIHLDGYQLHPHCKEYLSDEYLHPNAQGFAFYALNLIKAMLPYM